VRESVCANTDTDTDTDTDTRHLIPDTDTERLSGGKCPRLWRGPCPCRCLRTVSVSVSVSGTVSVSERLSSLSDSGTLA
jgi:hypothetical protein